MEVISKRGYLYTVTEIDPRIRVGTILGERDKNGRLLAAHEIVYINRENNELGIIPYDGH